MSGKTLVVFRKWRDGSIIALFPEVIADPQKNCTCYAHVGQHAAANYDVVISKTTPAKPEEYKALKKELIERGYDDLLVRKKFMR